MTGEIPIIRLPDRPSLGGPTAPMIAAVPAGRPAEHVDTAWPTAFVDLYQDRYQAMVRYAYLLVGNTELAEELAQEAFLLVRRNWQRAEHPRAYLRMTVTNLCRSHHRRRALELRRRPPPPDPAELGADEMWDAIATLPFRQRAVVVLRFYEDLPEAQIAEILGCATGTVASSLHRGLAKLRKELGE